MPLTQATQLTEPLADMTREGQARGCRGGNARGDPGQSGPGEGSQGGAAGAAKKRIVYSGQNVQNVSVDLIPSLRMA